MLCYKYTIWNILKSECPFEIQQVDLLFTSYKFLIWFLYRYHGRLDRSEISIYLKFIVFVPFIFPAFSRSPHFLSYPMNYLSFSHLSSSSLLSDPTYNFSSFWNGFWRERHGRSFLPALLLRNYQCYITHFPPFPLPSSSSSSASSTKLPGAA